MVYGFRALGSRAEGLVLRILGFREGLGFRVLGFRFGA